MMRFSVLEMILGGNPGGGRVILPNKCYMLLEIDLLWQVLQQKACLYGVGAIDPLMGKILNILTWGELFMSKSGSRSFLQDIQYTDTQNSPCPKYML